MDKVILYGNGSVARASYYEFAYDSAYEVAGFTVDRRFMRDNDNVMFNLPVVPFDEVQSIFPPAEFGMHISVGYVGVNRVRAERFLQAKDMGYRLVDYISSKALIGAEVEIGENCSIGVNSVIHSFVKIGSNVTIGANTFIGHDVVIGDHCYLSECVTIAGSVEVEPYCFFGIKSTIRNKVRIAQDCVISAGALILQDTQAKQVYLGKPADLLAIRSDELPIK